MGDLDDSDFNPGASHAFAHGSHAGGSPSRFFSNLDPLATSNDGGLSPVRSRAAAGSEGAAAVESPFAPRVPGGLATIQEFLEASSSSSSGASTPRAAEPNGHESTVAADGTVGGALSGAAAAADNALSSKASSPEASSPKASPPAGLPAGSYRIDMDSDSDASAEASARSAEANGAASPERSGNCASSGGAGVNPESNHHDWNGSPKQLSNSSGLSTRSQSPSVVRSLGEILDAISVCSESCMLWSFSSPDRACVRLLESLTALHLVFFASADI